MTCGRQPSRASVTIARVQREMEMDSREIFKQAWDTTWMSMEASLSDWRLHVGAAICIGGVLAFHMLVYRLPELLIPYCSCRGFS